MTLTVLSIACKSFDGDSVSGACFFTALNLSWLHISKKVKKKKNWEFWFEWRQTQVWSREVHLIVMLV